MTVLPHNTEIKTYNEFILSLKSLSGDININDSTWDSMFTAHENFTEFYFIGKRLQFEIADFKENIDYISTEVLCSKHKNFEILVKLKPSVLFISRNLLEKFWSHYEYPALIFVESVIDRKKLIDFFNSRQSHHDFVEANGGISMFYRSFELDVLWVAQSLMCSARFLS